MPFPSLGDLPDPESEPVLIRRQADFFFPVFLFFGRQILYHYYSVLKSNEIVICAAIWTNLKNILLSERSQTKEDNIV